MRRFLLKALAMLVGLVAMLAAALYVYVRRSLPVLNGTIAVAGTSGPIEIVRDADAIPHIYAATSLDGLFGLGYVHAQDRLWQMEFQRRIGFGRLSEIFGAATLPQDRFLRTVGFGRAAQSAWSHLPERTRTAVNAYVAGVNAFVTTHRASRLPPEFSLLRFEPEPWTGPDVVVWQKMMAWDLSANFSFELLRHEIANKVGPEGLADLMPPYAEGGLSILGQAGRAGQAGTAGQGFLNQPVQPVQPTRPPPAALWSAAFTAALSHGVPGVRDILTGGAMAEALGSNNWVVDGTRTTTGKPLLANDPHLGTKIPSIWYFAHISAGDYDVIGASLPGTPAIFLGRNRFIAWGATNVAADVEDLYRETIDETGRLVEFQGRQEPLQIVPETIAIKGAEPVRIDVRISRHGPIVSDAINANNAASPRTRELPRLDPLAFRWTALEPDDNTVSAALRMMEARDWNQFTAALQDFVVPSQNIVYADVEGHIGYYAPGRIPMRAAGDGSMPVDGKSGSFEWTGWVPFDRLPHAYNPPEHVIVTANQRPMPADYPYLLGLEWPESYRAQRITSLLANKTRMSSDDFAAIQGDTQSLHAERILPALLARARPQSAADIEAVRLLRRWNYDARGNSAAAALFEAWFLQLAPTIVGDELGPLTLDTYQGRFSYVTRFLMHMLSEPNPSGSSSSVVSGSSSSVVSGFSRTWCDNVNTPATETCEDAVTTALHDAVARLSREGDREMGAWRWETFHRIVFPHQGLDSISVLRPLLSRSAPGSGDFSTVNVGAVAANQPYEQHSVAGFREIIDLSPANDSRFIDALGESGHPLSPHYDDFLEDWRAVKHRRMRMERSEVERNAIGRLRLTPSP